MKLTIPATWRGWITLVCAVILAATGIAVTVGSGNNNITINVQGPEGPTTVTTTPAALDAVEKTDAGDHTALALPPPSCDSIVLHEPVAPATEQPCVPQAQLDAAAAQQAALAAKDDFPTVAPNSSPTTAGCRSRFINTNYSSRGGIKPRLIVLHLTVSPDNGWTGVNSITSFFANPATAASSNYVVSGLGDCNYIVRETDKAWTQATFNPVSISFEVTATQTQGYYVKSLGREKLARIIVGISKRWGIPIRRGATSGCSVTRSGIVDHTTLGACGGNHNDIEPYRNEINKIKNRALQIVAARSATTRRCNELRRIRHRSAGHNWNTWRIARATALKDALGPAKAATCI